MMELSWCSCGGGGGWLSAALEKGSPVWNGGSQY